MALVAACSRGGASAPPRAAPGAVTASDPSVATTRAVRPGATAPPTVATTTIPTVAAAATDPPATAHAPATADTLATDAPATSDAAGLPAGPLAGISMTAVPPGVIVPTTDASLDKAPNPINGRRGGTLPAPGAYDCVSHGADPAPCLTQTRDRLGFDVTTAPASDAERRLERATAVVQLDAGRSVTGVADE